jgi:triacylglycerol lipase
MDSPSILSPAGRDRRLAWSLRAIVVGETLGLGLLAAHLLQLQWALASVVIGSAGLWLLLRLFVPLGSFTFKLALGDWSRDVRGAFVRALTVLARESWWMARLYWWDQPWRALPPHLRPGDTRPPVILVHGFLCNAALWKPLIDSGAFADRSVVALSLEPTYRRFIAQLRALSECVHAVREATGAAKVVLIGHSMGGLLSRAFAEEFPQLVSGVVAIAAPHHGTWFGNLVFGPENGPPSSRSGWLKVFNRRTREHLPVPALNLWTAEDNIVIPARGSRLAHTGEVKLEGLGHMAAIASAAGRTAIVAALREIEQVCLAID